MVRQQNERSGRSISVKQNHRGFRVAGICPGPQGDSEGRSFSHSELTVLSGTGGAPDDPRAPLSRAPPHAAVKMKMRRRILCGMA